MAVPGLIIRIVDVDNQEVENDAREPAKQYHADDVAENLVNILDNYLLKYHQLIRHLPHIPIHVILIAYLIAEKAAFGEQGLEELVVVFVLEYSQEEADSQNFEKHKAPQPGRLLEIAE